MKNLLKAMALTFFWIASIPFRFWDISLILIAIASPALITSLIWGWNNSGRYTVVTECCIVILALISILKFGKWEKDKELGYEHFAGWKWES